MMHSRVFHLAVRLAIAAFVFILLVYCGLRIYITDIAHRSVALLDEAARIQIGASEDSILPLVARYGGIKWTPPPAAP